MGASKNNESRRLTKLLASLDQEEARLKTLAEQRGAARLLQAVLWQYPADTRLAGITVAAGAARAAPSPCSEDGHELSACSMLEDPSAARDEAGDKRSIVLNPSLTLRENMTGMFRSSARVRRGLERLKQRRAEALAALDVADEAEAAVDSRLAETSDAPARTGTERPVEDAEPRDPRIGSSAGASPADKRARRPEKALKDVSRLISSDGFTMLRGKNSRGNQALLKLGRPHDLWLHALEGPSAHLIIRRAHAAEDIPDTTLREAALLVGEKSWQRHDARARIMVALLRHVHSIKGAAPGTVRVDEILRTVTVVFGS